MLIALTGAREAAADPVGAEIALRAGTGYPLAFGLGVRVGASIEAFYFGLTVTDYLPRTITPTLPSGPATQGLSETETLQTLLYGAELGYDLKPVTWLTIRPEIGAGFASVSGTCSTSPGPAADLSCDPDAGTNPYVEPGVTVLFGLGTHLFVAANSGVVIVPKGNGSVVPLIAEGGVRF